MTILDLDAVASELQQYRERLMGQGWAVEDLTWLDGADETWPYPLKARADTVEPVSVGLHATKQPFEFRIVVWVGGWADLDAADFELGAIRTENPAIHDIGSLRDELERLSASWRHAPQ
jgi:hypothetical protein